MTKDDLKQLGDLIDTKIDGRFDELDQKLFEWKSEIFNLVDGLALEVRDQREFRTVVGHQIVEHRERIDGLEKKVFGGVKNAA